MPVSARGLYLVTGLPQGETSSARGKAVPGSGFGVAPLCAGARRARPPAARFAAPSRSAHGPRRHERMELTACERPTSSSARRGGRAAWSPGEDQKQALAAGQRVGGITPSPCGQALVSPEPVKWPGNRKLSQTETFLGHLTEPVRRKRAEEPRPSGNYAVVQAKAIAADDPVSDAHATD